MITKEDVDLFFVIVLAILLATGAVWLMRNVPGEKD